MKVVLKDGCPISFELCSDEVEVAIRDYVRQKLNEKFGDQSWIITGDFDVSSYGYFKSYSGNVDIPEQPSEITEVEL